MNPIEASTLVNDLKTKGWHVNDALFSHDLCMKLLKYLDDAWVEERFHKSGIGAGDKLQIKESIRGDQILWVDELDEQPTIKDMNEFLVQIRNILNENLFLNIKTFEGHFALYPPGTHYDKHVDQHQGHQTRKITLVLYLNEFWKKDDGGELVLYDPLKLNQEIQKIDPIFARAVFFSSDEFPHEVLTSKIYRKSFTGWFR